MTGIKARIHYPGTDPTVAYDLEAVTTYQRKLWLGILAIGVAIAAIGFARSGATPVVSLPGALPLFVMGLAGLGLISWRRKKKA